MVEKWLPGGGANGNHITGRELLDQSTGPGMEEVAPGLWRWTAPHPAWMPGAQPCSPTIGTTARRMRVGRTIAFAGNRLNGSRSPRRQGGGQRADGRAIARHSWDRRDRGPRSAPVGSSGRRVYRVAPPSGGGDHDCFSAQRERLPYASGILPLAPGSQMISRSRGIARSTSGTTTIPISDGRRAFDEYDLERPAEPTTAQPADAGRSPPLPAPVARC
jgi:hypothetical protein